MNNEQQIQVECCSGYKVDEPPVAFAFQDRRWEVSEILDRWHEGGVAPEYLVVDYFKVRTNDGSDFILRYEAESDVWSVIVPKGQVI